MAIEVLSVNEVYKSVLAILNKEQRGYITPYEFNLLATQVQLEIFESYFNSLRMALQKPGNDNEYANQIKTLRQKISRFENEEEINVTIVDGKGQGDLTTLTGLFKLGTVYYNNGSKLPVQVEQVERPEFNLLRRSQLTSPSSSFPVYYQEQGLIKILPAIASVAAGVDGSPKQSYTVEYLRKPANVVWNYSIGAVGQYVHNPAAPNQNFEISPTEQTEVIIKILAYAGVVIRDPEIIQTATQAAAVKDQQQMQ